MLYLGMKYLDVKAENSIAYLCYCF